MDNKCVSIVEANVNVSIHTLSFLLSLLPRSSKRTRPAVWSGQRQAPLGLGGILDLFFSRDTKQNSFQCHFFLPRHLDHSRCWSPLGSADGPWQSILIWFSFLLQIYSLESVTNYSRKVILKNGCLVCSKLFHYNKY